MPTKRLELAGHLSVEELKVRMKSAPDPRQTRRWQVLWHLSQGKSTAQAAEACGFSVRWVQMLAGRFNKEGASAVSCPKREHSGGAEPLLNSAQKQ